MTSWQPTPGPIRHRGRHRRPVLHVDEATIIDNYLADFDRARRDGRDVDEALTLAGMDSDARLLAWAVAS